MENILLRYCRDANNYSAQFIAKQLKIDAATYRKIEQGEVLLSNNQSKVLGKLYKVDQNYFYAAALQLDLLLSLRKLTSTIKSSNKTKPRRVKTFGKFCR